MVLEQPWCDSASAPSHHGPVLLFRDDGGQWRAGYKFHEPARSLVKITVFLFSIYL